MLLPFDRPACVGPLIDVIVPPQIVRRRETPEYASALRTERPSAAKGSDGNAAELDAGIPGHMDETPPPLPLHIGGFTQPLYVARKS